VDTANTNAPAYGFKKTIFGFCNTGDPNYFDLLMSMLDFTAYARIPEALSLVPDNIKTLTSLRARFTSSASMNVPTTTPGQPAGAPASASPKAGSSSSAAVANSAASTSAINACWSTAACTGFVGKFTGCRKKSPDFTDPNNIAYESGVYQSCLCDNSEYKE